MRAALLIALLAAPCFDGANLDWKAVDPADLALKSARVEQDADAEALLWEVWVTDELQGSEPHSVLAHYIRLKIFTERGRNQHSTIDLPYSGKNRIADIAGRTIKPDGSIVELKKDAIFERTLVKAGDLKVTAKSFAMPGIEPGAIVEYRWREYHDDQLANYIRLSFQQEFPVQLVVYHIKPLESPRFPFHMRSLGYRATNTPFEKEPGGFYRTSMENVPAFVAEPHMPPHNEVRPWMLIYYVKEEHPDSDAYWKTFGKHNYDSFKELMKGSAEVRRVADSIVSGAANDDEKLQRIFEYCRNKIQNLRSALVTNEERSEAKRNKSPADTLQQGVGTGRDIDMAFAALAAAEGFETRIARLGDRSDTFFDPKFPDPYFLRSYNVAIKWHGEWRFFDPANTYAPFGMLRWQEEGEKALLLDAKDPEFVTTPLAPPEKSASKRQGRFTLTADGTLEGDVRVEYSGHQAILRRQRMEAESQEQRAENLGHNVRERLSSAEVTSIQYLDLTAADKPLVCQYHVKVPNYAQHTAKRLFLQPGYFQFNVPPMFAAATRKYPVYFNYPWSEDDDIEIQLPPGFELDHADAPPSLSFGSAGNYLVKVQISKTRKLIYHRQLSFGSNGRIYFPVESYPQMKQGFDRIHESDNHTLTLKQEDAKP